MVYSNDEVQDKLNNANNSNADAKTVRDLSASKNSSKREESNKAKQQILLEEAIENNDTFKRLKQTLAKTTSGRMQVTAEDVAEIYTSMVSPSVNTVGENGAFFVDDKLISMAVGGMCYDISIEENGIVLNVDGTLNVEETKKQVAMISGNAPREDLDAYKAQLMKEKEQYFNKNENEYFTTKTISKSDFLLNKIDKMSNEELGEYLKSKEGKNEVAKANNSEEIDDVIAKKRKDTNMTSEEVEVRAMEAKLYTMLIEKNELTDPAQKKIKAAVIANYLTKIQSKLYLEKNPYLQKLTDKKGELSLRILIEDYEKYRTDYSDKENLIFIQEASREKLWKVGHKTNLDFEDKEFLREFLERSYSILASDDPSMQSVKSAIMIDMTALGLRDRSGELNLKKYIEKYNSVSPIQVSSTKELLEVAVVERFDVETQEQIDMLEDLRKKDGLHTRTEEDLEKLEEERRYGSSRAVVETEEVSLTPFQKINDFLEKMREEAKNETLNLNLEEMFKKAGVEGDELQAAMIAKVFIHSREAMVAAHKAHDQEAIEHNQKRMQDIRKYVLENSIKYKSIINKKGRIDLSMIDEEMLEQLNDPGNEKFLADNGLSVESISDAFNDYSNNKGHISLSFAMKNVSGAIKNFVIAKRDSRKAQKLLNSGKEIETSQYIEKLTSIASSLDDSIPDTSRDAFRIAKGQRVLNQEEIDMVIETMRSDFINEGKQKKGDSFRKRTRRERKITQEEIDILVPEVQKEGTENGKTFDEQLRAGVQVNEREAVQKTQETQIQASAVLKVDIGTMRKMAFEICQKKEFLASISPMLNDMSADDLKEFIDLYGNEQTNLIELQPDKAERSSSDGSER